MREPPRLFRQAQSLGLRLEADGSYLLVRPASKCPAEFADVLRQHKGELLNWLSSAPLPGWQAVPPKELPLNPVMPHPALHDRERMIAYLIRQGCDKPCRLAGWIVQRECAYYDGPGRAWDCGLLAYAAARDAACWQLNRSEGDVWGVLAGCNDHAKRLY